MLSNTPALEAEGYGKMNKYPYIGKFNGNEFNTIVLFTSEYTGICLTDDIRDSNQVGDFSRTWQENKFKEVEIQETEQ